MKMKLLALAATCAVLGSNVAQAANPDGCYWNKGGVGDQKRYFTMTAPSQMDLQSVAIGGVMASAPNATIHTEIMQIKCPYPAVQNYRGDYYVSDAELADGFTDVYKTSIPGLGVRFKSNASGTIGNLPMIDPYPNAATIYTNVIKAVQLEFIRTARDVGQGMVSMNFTIEQNINGWNAAQIKVGGSTSFETRSYFSGCAGVEKLTIPLGKISISEIGKQQKQFNLDVLCSGLPAGTKIPVRVYFEGSSDGPGRLNLDAGGAKGVEIALKDGKGALLPFSKGSALAMDWINSQPGGELYRLSVSAGYAHKNAQTIEVGKANGTLNYIIDYD
ncbi:fimbrial protein [Pseudomonas sp. NFIX28]|uniref:fimbrial protein n=1 Tax=Pseudomonas sp. NFIX28 TaxID=1566235 RepID=UPI00089AA5E1|nr:fimbrial protein [Pseudomonas sp. NFIX28]SDY57683.1 Pilin (type 1 fimbria component protein) [Pseudomonas sp. NFIX28]